MFRSREFRLLIRRVSDIIVIIALAWFIVYSFLTQATVSGHSMETVLSDGDLVLVDTLSYKFVDPSRFDIVVFMKSDGSESIKRIIGLPGERVVIQNGRVYIDGTLLESDELGEVSLPGIAESPVILREDEYFILGDNTDSSEDSRFDTIGNVDKSQIRGKAWARIAPISRIGLIE